MKNWDRYQHGHKRDYPWIKVYSSLLSDNDYLALPEGAQRLLLHIWIVAANNSGTVPERHSDVLRATHTRNTHVTRKYVKLLQDKGFIVSDASTSRVEESRVDTPIVPTGTVTQIPPVYDRPEIPAVEPTPAVAAAPPDFEAVWKTYPKRAGGNPKQSAAKAYAARIREGILPDELFRAVERYAAYCRATGKIGTEYVLQAGTFFGPQRRWEEAYDAPTEPIVILDFDEMMADVSPETRARMERFSDRRRIHA